MRAVRLHDTGLAVEEIEAPTAHEGEALIRVHAAAITRDELTWPVDRLPAIPSYELSGVVAHVAPDVDDVEVGEEVFALTPFDRDGVAAEYAVVPAIVLAPRPMSLTHVESATLPMTGLSAWQGIFEHGDELANAVGLGSRVVSIAEEADGATYFVVEPDRAQLVELGRRADAGELTPAVDSVFSLEEAGAAFDRVGERGKQGKVVLRVGDD